MKRHISFSLILLLALHQTITPVHPGKAAGGIIAAGALGASITYLNDYYAEEIAHAKRELRWHIEMHKREYTMGIIGAICTLIGASILIPKTPQYRLYTAKKTINATSNEHLTETITRNIHAPDTELVQIIENMYQTCNHPHVICANTLSKYIDNLYSAINKLDKVVAEKQNDSAIVQECEKYRQQANQLILDLTKALKILKMLPNYLAECKAYDDMMEARRISDQIAWQTTCQNVHFLNRY